MNLRAVLFPFPPSTPGSAGLLGLPGFAGQHHFSKGDPFAKWQLAALYLCISVVVLLGGPGRFSFDAVVRARLESGAGK